jgi:hypothetical protein
MFLGIPDPDPLVRCTCPQPGQACSTVYIRTIGQNYLQSCGSGSLNPGPDPAFQVNPDADPGF